MRIPSSLACTAGYWLHPAQSIARSALWLFVVAWRSRVRDRFAGDGLKQWLRDGNMDYDIFASTGIEWC
jgi:hypothetical protein